ncbi:fimbria/pilus periplasmic chaperone, partial [Pseudomonas syringae pv. tagetis]
TWICALLSVSAALPASAAVTLQGTRIVHDASKGRDVTVRASNVGELPAMTQVWIDDGDSQSRPENVRTPFRLTPAEPRLLQPKQGQAYRV